MRKYAAIIIGLVLLLSTVSVATIPANGVSWKPHPTKHPHPTKSPIVTPSPTILPTPIVTPVPTPTPSFTPTPEPTSTIPPPAGTWVNILTEEFSTTLQDIYGRWEIYDGPYGSGSRNCATPNHLSVINGNLEMLMAYEATGKCGAGWYTGGLQVLGIYGAVDQRVTTRFSVVTNGAISHKVIPMRWP